MSSTSYVATQNGNFTPINVRAAGIKCLTCGNEYPQNKMQGHLLTHVSPKYQKPIAQAPESKKSKLFDLQDQDKSSEIDVVSFFPSQLPKTDSQPKKQPVPKSKDNSRPENFNDSIPDQMQNGLIAKPDDQENYADESTEHQEKQTQDFLTYDKVIKIQTSKEAVSKKAIRFYENDNVGGVLVDQGGNSQKVKRNLDDDQSTEMYELERTEHESDEDNTQKKVKKERVNLHGKKHVPKNKMLISTKIGPAQSTSRSKDESDSSTVTPYLGTQRKEEKDTMGTGRKTERKEHQNHTCPCCGGFYCSTCNSDIPPMYRPVPDNQGKFSQEVMDWYAKRGNPKAEMNCNSCNKEKKQ